MRFFLVFGGLFGQISRVFVSSLENLAIPRKKSGSLSLEKIITLLSAVKVAFIL
jgi:hypothetical protein